MRRRTIHIMAATLTVGDAIGNYCRMLQRIFWKKGFSVKLYADLWDARSVCTSSHQFTAQVKDGDLLWYHFSIFSENMKIPLCYKGVTVLDYHGVTPPQLFHGYSAHLESLCIKARELLPKFAPHTDLAICHSEYTANELREKGFTKVLKVPLAIDTTRFSEGEDSSLSETLKKYDYLLFVGRLTPQKSILEMIRFFSRVHLKFPLLKLFIVGEYSYSEQYVAEIRSLIASKQLDQKVFLLGKVTDSRVLGSLYANARFTVYLSHWETFCVPLVESMHFGTPVIGLAQTAIPEVLADGGILVPDLDPGSIAAKVIPYLTEDREYRLLRQSALQRAAEFTEEKMAQRIEELVFPKLGLQPKKQKLAMVVQRYGKSVPGGAEMLCRQFAERLARHFEVHVFTSCARDYHTWESEFPPGSAVEDGVTVHRYEVIHKRDMEAFIAISEKMFEPGVEKISFSDSMEWMRLQGPRVPNLLHSLQATHEEYEFIFFFTYLYYTTALYLPLLRHKAVLIPTAHNEPPIYLKVFRELFRMPRGIMYLTDAERDFVLRMHENHHIPAVVVGVGIEEPSELDAADFCQRYGLSGAFILYVGRIARSKGCDELFDYFSRYRKQTNSKLTLVLIGEPKLTIPDEPYIVSLGFLHEKDKNSALKAAMVVVNSSPFESLSFSILEAWSVCTPTLVNGKCDVLADHTARSGGGLMYYDEKSFIQTLQSLEENPEKRTEMGEKGKKYVDNCFRWKHVDTKIMEFLSELHNPTKQSLNW